MPSFFVMPPVYYPFLFYHTTVRRLHEKKRCGRPPKMYMGCPGKKESQTELEKLQAENLRLKTENVLLKKRRP